MSRMVENPGKSGIASIGVITSVQNQILQDPRSVQKLRVFNDQYDTLVSLITNKRLFI